MAKKKDMFRKLRADEIEVRVGSVGPNATSFLLYKDARVDQNILDETVGPMNWQKEYSRDNQNCTVSIWDEEKAQWISKEDTGTESFTEKEKGLASDAFKRACFVWGIGRELYTTPDIWIKNDKLDIYTKTNANGKEIRGCNTKLKVTEIEYDDMGRISKLCINKFAFGTIKESVFEYQQGQSQTPAKAPAPAKKAEPEKEATAEAPEKEAKKTTKVKTAEPTTEEKAEEPKAEEKKPAAKQSEKAAICDCELCKKGINSQKVIDYTTQNYGAPICYDCQQTLSKAEIKTLKDNVAVGKPFINPKKQASSSGDMEMEEDDFPF